jgi:competence protein ComEA
MGAARILAVVGLLAATLLALRATLPADDLAIEPIQVVGEVPAPGWYLLENATLHGAIQAAGGDPTAWPDLPLASGWRVVIQNGDVRLEPSGEDLVFGLPLNLNRADAQALQALPGIGGVLSEAVVKYRESQGPFMAIDDLESVPGIGPARLEALRPFLTVEP